MFKRVGLFLLTNILVVITIGVLMGIILPMFGIRLEGFMGLAIFCGIFGMSGAFISLAISRWMAKKAYKIQLITGNETNYELRELYQMVARLSKQAKLPEIPEVGIYQSNEPNAFATGPSKSSSIVAFSTGLLNNMNKNEVEAVASHEISHIANGDMITMTLLTGVVNTLVMFLSRVIAGIINNFLSEDGEGGLGFFAYIMLVLTLDAIFMIFASIPIAAFSRYREYRADAGAARLSSPSAMASALKTLGAAAQQMQTQKDSFAIAKISSTRKVSLWATHPPIEARIKRLERM